MDINKAFEILMTFEGGLSDDKADRGGMTKYGVSRASHPELDIAGLTKEQAKAIYYKEYWIPSYCSELKPELQYIHFDTAVNCGVGMAARLLQRASRVKEDGVIGHTTLLTAMNTSINEYAGIRIKYCNAVVEKDKVQSIFLQGWINRINKIIALWQAGLL